MRRIFFNLISLCVLISCGCDRQHGKYTDSELHNLLSGTWYVTQKGDSIWSGFGQISFFSEDNRYSVYDGCNHSSGDYEIEDGYVSLEDGPWTEMYCPCEGSVGVGSKQPLTITKIEIDGAECVELEGKLSPYRASLNVGTKMFTTILRRPGKWMLDGNWVVKRIDGDPTGHSGIFMSFNKHTDRATILIGSHTMEIPYGVNQENQISFDTTAQAPDYNFFSELIRALGQTTKFTPDIAPDCASFRDLGARADCDLVIELRDGSDRCMVYLARPINYDIEYD